MDTHRSSSWKRAVSLEHKHRSRSTTWTYGECSLTQTAKRHLIWCPQVITSLHLDRGHTLLQELRPSWGCVPGKVPWSSVSLAKRNLARHRFITTPRKPTQKTMRPTRRCDVPSIKLRASRSNQSSSRSWSGGEPQRHASVRGLATRMVGISHARPKSKGKQEGPRQFFQKWFLEKKTRKCIKWSNCNPFFF